VISLNTGWEMATSSQLTFGRILTFRSRYLCVQTAISRSLWFIVEELNSAEFQNRVRIVGGIAEPKSISHRDGMTVIDLVLEAGGVNEFSSPEGARLYRTIDGQPRVFPVYLQSILQDGILDTNYLLQPGDVISVPERRF